MPQTLTVWILIAAVMVSGAGGGYSASRVVTSILNGFEIDRRDVVATITFAAMLVASALLLLSVDGQ